MRQTQHIRDCFMHIKAVLVALLAFAIFSTHDVIVKYLGATNGALF